MLDHPLPLAAIDRALWRGICAVVLGVWLPSGCGAAPKSDGAPAPPSGDSGVPCPDGAAASECNGLDDDCDGVVDEPAEPATPVWYLDADSDGFGAPSQPVEACAEPARHVDNALDCDDTDPERHPAAVDVVGDGVDQDCDGSDATCDPATPAHRPFVGDVELRGSAATSAAADLCAAHDGVDGTLAVVGTPWTDLSALGCICAVTDGLIVAENPSLTSLAGLPAGRRLGRVVEVTDSPSLTSTAGLAGTTWLEVSAGDERLLVRDAAGLTSLGGFDGWSQLDLLQLRDLPRLEAVSGLDDLVQVHESLEVRDNASLRAVTGLGALVSTDELRLEDNPQLTSLEGLGRLRSVRYLTLGGNRLPDLADLSSLLAIDVRLTARSAPALTSLAGLTQLERLGGLRITDNPELASLAGLADAAGAEGIGGTVELSGNPRLTNLQGLDWVTWIEGDLILGGTGAMTPLESLAGLDQLEVVVGAVVLQRLLLLDDLEGLGALREVGALRIDGTDQPATDTFTPVGVASLETIHATLDVRNHPSLVALHGLAGVSTVGDVVLLDNPSLRGLGGLDGLRTADSLLALRNPRLTDVSALYGLQSVGDVCLEVPGDPAEPDALLAALGTSAVCP